MIPLRAHKVSQNETNKVPKVHVFQNYLIKLSNTKSLATRDINSNINFNVPCVRPNYGKHKCKFAMTKIWGEIPISIIARSKSETSTYAFIIYFKQ